MCATATLMGKTDIYKPMGLGYSGVQLFSRPGAENNDAKNSAPARSDGSIFQMATLVCSFLTILDFVFRPYQNDFLPLVG